MAKIPWKTAEEIEQEKNEPKPPSDKERLESLEQAMIMLMMEG